MEQLLTKTEEKRLEQLRDLLEFGSEIFLQYLQAGINDRNYKKSFIILYLGAIHNYSESIYVLCREARPHASTVLLRSIFEAFINVIYLTNTNSDLKIAKFTIHDFEERIKSLKQFKAFVVKFPEWEGKDGLTNTKNLDNMIEFNQRHKDAVERGNKFHKTTDIEPNLRKKAEAYDKKTRSGGKWEFNYLLIYKYFSTFTHLSISGIESFLDEENGEINFDLGQSKGVEPHLVTCFGIYLALLNNIKKRNYIPKGVSLKKFNQQFDQMHKD